MTQGTIGVTRSRIMGIRTDGSFYSLPSVALMESRPEGPSYPTSVTATSTLEGVLLRWTAPTVNADGTTLNAGAINGYWVYEREGASPTTSTYDDRFWVEALLFPWPADNSNEHSFGITTVNNSGQESVISSIVSAKANYSSDYDNDPDNRTGGLIISDEYIGYYSTDESGWFSYLKNDGAFYLTGYDAAGSWGDSFFQWNPGSSTPGNPATLIIEGTYKTDAASDQDRIEIYGSGADDGWLASIDSSSKNRVGIFTSGVHVWDSTGGSLSSPSTNRIFFVGTAVTDDIVIKHNHILIHNALIVGTGSDPATADDLYVDGAARLGTGSTAVDLVVGDHGTASTDQVINVCYGTGSAPSASTTTEGALYIKYTA